MIPLLTFTSLAGLILAAYCWWQWDKVEKENTALRADLAFAVKELARFQNKDIASDPALVRVGRALRPLRVVRDDGPKGAA